MNLNNKTFTESRINDIAYIAICLVMHEVMVAGIRIAMAGELGNVKTAIRPRRFDLEVNSKLLRRMKEPHVKLASALSDYVRFKVLTPFVRINSLNDAKVLAEERKDELGARFCWGFMFYRDRQRLRDRYVNFNKILLHSKQLIYEVMQLMVTGQTGAFNKDYPIRFSNVRLKAMSVANGNQNIMILKDLMDQLKVYIKKSKAIMIKS